MPKNAAICRLKSIKRTAKLRGWTFEQAEHYWEVDSLVCACGQPKGRTCDFCPACAKVSREATRAKYLSTHGDQARLADRIRWRMNAGMTREQAEELEGTAGVCACGKKAKRQNGRICVECYQAKDREAKRGKPSRLVDKACQKCGAGFQGTSNAKYCSLHKSGVKAKKVAARPVMPQTWDKSVVEKQPVQAESASKLTADQVQARVAELKRQEQANIAAAMARIEEQRGQRAGFKRGVDKAEIDPAKERAFTEVMGRMR